MSSGCLLSTVGSGLSVALYRGPRHFWRRWVRRCTQCISRPPSRGDKQVLANMLDHNSPNYLKNVVDYMATAVNKNDRLFVCTFLTGYPKYATTWEVLELFMKRYPSFRPDCKEDQKDKQAIAYFLRFWFENLPEDFCESPNLTVLNQLKTYLSINIPSSNLAAWVQLLLSVTENKGHRNKNPKDEEAHGSSELQAQDGTLEIDASVPMGELPPTEDPVEPINNMDI